MMEHEHVCDGPDDWDQVWKKTRRPDVLLDDCGKMVLVSTLQDGPNDESFLRNVDHGVVSDDYKDEEVEYPSATLKLARTLDPSQLGLGHSFTYAASN